MAGGHVDVELGMAYLDELFYTYASEEQPSYVKPSLEFSVANCDAVLSIGAEFNTKRLAGIDAERIAKNHRTYRDLQKRFMERAAMGELRWCYTLFPTQATAQGAGLSLLGFREFVFSAGLLDREDPVAEWRRIDTQQEALVSFLNWRPTPELVT